MNTGARKNNGGILPLVLSIIALLISGVAYWRSGGKQDITKVSHEIDESIERLQSKQKELVDETSVAMQAVYERAQGQMKSASGRLTKIRKNSTKALTNQIDEASKQLIALEGRLADGLKSFKQSTISAAHETQNALVKRVQRMEARVSILRCKRKIDQALELAEKKEFEAAEEQLAEAVNLVIDARTSLKHDHDYDEKLDTVSDTLRKAVTSVRAKAENIRSHIEEVIMTTDALISVLESDEQKAEDAQS